jgi:hypothetical protein
VSDRQQEGMLKSLLLRTQHRSRLCAALVALCLGTTLLLLSVMIWWNFSELLYGKSQGDSLGSTFLVIGKKVTDQNMGSPNATNFSPADIEGVRQAPQVEDIGLITSSHFPIYAMMGGRVPLATDLPLESVPDKFIDRMPEGWKWEPGSKDLPIIISSQFLDVYNYVFAPGQGLPQLSQSSVKSIALNLKVGREGKTETFLAHIVGFSDRIGSVLAPQSFIDYGNKNYGAPGLSETYSQLIVKAKDPSDKKFADYLLQHDYSTNSQNLRWSKVRSIVEIVSGATGILALLLMGIGTLVFVLFIELTVAKAQHSLTLLLQIGYSPKYISGFMVKRFLPMILGTVVVSMLIAFAGQAVAYTAAHKQDLVLPLLPGWPVWGALLLSTSILLVLVTRSISNAVKK